MRWTRPRFTVRRLMIAVAIAAILLGLAVQWARWRRLSAFCEREAAQAGFREAVSQQLVAVEEWSERTHLDNARLAREELAKPMYQRPEWKEFLNGPDPLSLKYHEKEARDAATRIASRKKAAAYWRARKERYRRASRSLWPTIEPDPPIPE